nr:MAG TPA: hypothetical protein [Caudoviricetes sp.]
MNFINIISTDMTNTAAVKTAVADLFNMKRAYDAASYHDSVFNRVVEGLNTELKELGKSVVIEAESNSLITGSGGETEVEVLDMDFVDTNYGDIHAIVDYSYYNGSTLTVEINGKEVKDFNWKVGYSIVEVVAGYLAGLPLPFAHTKVQ